MSNSCAKCKREYHCCINPSSKGYVAVYINEASRIKKSTGKNYNDFLTFKKLPAKLVNASRNDKTNSEAKLRYTMMLNGRILRLTTGKNGECVFLKKRKCAIYKIRPSICRIYPYWFRNKTIIIHAGCTYCGLIDKEYKHTKLSRNELKQLIKTANEIKKQTKYYKKHITEFIKENSIE